MYGCGSRIWTYDLRVMSPTSYQTALSRVIGAEDRNRTDTVFYHRRILSPVRLPVPPPRHLAPRVGLEPTAYRLTAECSTIELPRIITTPKSGVRFLKFDYFFRKFNVFHERRFERGNLKFFIFKEDFWSEAERMELLNFPLVIKL